MLKESLKIHGSRQLEIKQKVFYGKDERDLKYRIDSYFFFPSPLQVTEATFGKSEFSKNLKCYLRLTEPECSFVELNNLLFHLKEFILAANKASDLPEVENRLKYFCLAYKRSLQLELEALTKNASSLPTFLTNTEDILNSFRMLKDLLSAKPYSLDYLSKNKISLFDCFDEYLAIETASALKYLLAQTSDECREEVKAFWRRLDAYRKVNFPFAVPEGETKDSAFLLRWSVIKKYVSEILFLEVRYKDGAPLLKHSIYGVAAAFSMLFATVVAYFYQDKYGSLSFNLFLALVIAYIFKDRLKEILRDWLSKVIFRRWIPDRRLYIFEPGNSKPSGTAKESFSFLKEKELPQEISELIRNSHWISIFPSRPFGSVFLFRKEIHLKLRLFKESSGVIDIVRFNVSNFLHNLGATSMDVPIFDEEMFLSGEKLYHIYIIRVVTSGKHTDTEVTRLVVNAAGIKRVEIVKDFETGVSSIEECGQFIFT